MEVISMTKRQCILLLVLLGFACTTGKVWADAADNLQNEQDAFIHVAPDVVNVNVDEADRLADVLVGVGLKKAEAIVAYRQANGQFESLDDLLNVKGIGERTLERNRGLIVLH